ncbi:FxsB family cyclophane-forming radical SAM/SPASM peptide maturase [Paractinoplanes tereljensis]|uniref:FxsB family cyclophane-forming radical SAM/SPASM peptide maturase n=1 Tax=Paractinoplanes tereljensis TaxID=571912 RepID=UPI0019415A70|nr:FxsB family cyclophane-forming radical SAM/SPASM peptide maturase [Actinoplanes tereljensis]
MPFRHLLLKVHSRCNLACRYCYVYEHVDQSWRDRPKVMAHEVIDVAARRFAEHAVTWDLPRVAVTFHGGEPLLAGPDVLEYAIGAMRDAMPAGVAVRFTVQTNGILLTEPILDLFRRHQVRVGVSLDGGRQANDRERRFANGRGSYHQVAAGLAALRAEKYRHLYGGLLCTVDVRNDPVEVYEDLLAFAPPRIDLLLPHGNWTQPPPARIPGDPRTPYADWLIPIFDRWYDAPRRETDIRLFSAIMSLLLGGPSDTESVGLTPIDFVIVETDGAIEQGDALKTAAEGEAATGCNVLDHRFDDILGLPGIRARQTGLAGLGATCRACPLVQVCGGGHYAHRYEATSGFTNPSVYCADLQRLIRHIHGRMSEDLHRLTADTSTGTNS